MSENATQNAEPGRSGGKLNAQGERGKRLLANAKPNANQKWNGKRSTLKRGNGRTSVCLSENAERTPKGRRSGEGETLNAQEGRGASACPRTRTRTPNAELRSGEWGNAQRSRGTGGKRLLAENAERELNQKWRMKRSTLKRERRRVCLPENAERRTPNAELRSGEWGNAQRSREGTGGASVCLPENAER